MNVQELRIGNWIYISNEEGMRFPHLINLEYFKSDYHGNESAIPLTPDILEKAGFEKDYIKSGTYKGVSILINRLNGSKEEGSSIQLICYPDAEEGIMVEVGINGKVEIQPVKHLHTLQNLYFALTGKELEINL